MEKEFPFAYTFDDVLLVPRKSDVLPREVDTKTLFSRNIELKIPLVSAAMDTVTESGMAIALAQEGGIGVIHRNLSPEEQAEEVTKVKRSEFWMILDPVSLPPTQTVGKAQEIIKRRGISGIPIVEKSGRLVGIVTRRDVVFRDDRETPLSKIMKKKLITAPEGIQLEKAKEILLNYGIEKLPVIDNEGKLVGLITLRDIRKKLEHPNATVDSLGRLKVAAALGVGKGWEERLELLRKSEVDAVVIDTAHGHSKMVLDVADEIVKNYPSRKFDLVVGNVATEEGARDLVKIGVDAIKVGVGPGSICTTRVIAGVGVPQLSAIMSVASVSRGENVPIIADGGIRYSGDIVKAIAGGADSVMLGNLFAGTDEAPGEMTLLGGRRFKIYRGMGSLGALSSGSGDRYFQEGAVKFVPEGIEGIVPYRGSVHEVIFQLGGGLRSGMGYIGAHNLESLRLRAKFVRITEFGLRESHPHNISITKESSNYMDFSQ